MICQGDIDVYAPRGSYQLVIRQIEPKGIGALELAAGARQRLAAEGLFAPSANGRSRVSRAASLSSPVRPARAITDFLEVLRRRWRGAHVIIVPTRVQGKAPAGKSPPRSKRPIGCRSKSIAWSSAGAAAASKTCGPSTKSR